MSSIVRITDFSSRMPLRAFSGPRPLRPEMPGRKPSTLSQGSVESFMSLSKASKPEDKVAIFVSRNVLINELLESDLEWVTLSSKYLKDTLLKDGDLVLRAVKKRAAALGHAHSSLKSDPAFVLEAVKINGDAIIWANAKGINREVALAAWERAEEFRNNPLAV